jgi:hypothetical protein
MDSVGKPLGHGWSVQSLPGYGLGGRILNTALEDMQFHVQYKECGKDGA